MICKPRAITLLSLPQVCEVCGNERYMLLSDPGEKDARAVLPCPHCCGRSEDNRRRLLPIWHLPVRSES